MTIEFMTEQFIQTLNDSWATAQDLVAWIIGLIFVMFLLSFLLQSFD